MFEGRSLVADCLEWTQSIDSERMNEHPQSQCSYPMGNMKEVKAESPGHSSQSTHTSFTPGCPLLTLLLNFTPNYLVNPEPCSWGKRKRNSHLISQSTILQEVRKD